MAIIRSKVLDDLKSRAYDEFQMILGTSSLNANKNDCLEEVWITA